MSLKIHEFSTGINKAGDRNNWYSLGFAGEYMNKTLEEIPRAVQAAINNRWFAVAEGGATESPALIGREVEDEQGSWSVLAVVTRGRDEVQRPFSASRYFLCEGKGNVEKILRYWWKLNPRLVFNPFDSQRLSDFVNDHEKSTQVPLDKFQDILKNNIPIIYPSSESEQDIPPLIINAIAEKKAEEIGQLLAWAYQVEALEAPRSFQVIYPASREAEDILNRVIASHPTIKNSVQEEQAIKKAIGLLIQNRIKPEHLQIIEQGLGNSLIDFKYWQAMFDSQGATDAIKQGNYSPQTVRLLTLRAMVLPETLLQFLDWLGVRNKKDDCWKNCLDFQATVLGYLSELPQLAQKLLEGVRFVITQLLEKPERLEITAWLLISDDACWSELYKKSFRKDLDNDLRTRKNYKSKTSSLNDNWDQVMSNLFGYLQNNPHYKLEEYRIFVHLFYLTTDYPIAAVFCYVSVGNLPQELFNQLNPNNNYSTNVYGLTVYRQLSILEQIGGFIVPVYLVIPALMAFLLLGFFGRSYIPAFRSPSERSIDNTAQYLAKKLNPNQPEQSTVRQQLIEFLNNNKLEENSELSKNLTCAIKDQELQNATPFPDEYYCKISEETLKKGVKKFPETVKAVKSMISEIPQTTHTSKENDHKNYVYRLIANKLGIELKIFKNALLNQSSKDQEQVTYAIYLYQKENDINSPNGILGDKTKNKILEEIKPQPSPTPSPSS